jgi:hypothetical protein
MKFLSTYSQPCSKLGGSHSHCPVIWRNATSGCASSLSPASWAKRAFCPRQTWKIKIDIGKVSGDLPPEQQRQLLEIAPVLTEAIRKRTRA